MPSLAERHQQVREGKGPIRPDPVPAEVEGLKAAARLDLDAKVRAGEVDDDTLRTIPSIYPAWDPNGVDYPVGALAEWDGRLVECVQTHTSQPDWNPDDAQSLWMRHRVDGDPWRQPAGAHDAYSAGEIVTHDPDGQGDRRWESDVDGNTWEPPEQWTEFD